MLLEVAPLGPLQAELPGDLVSMRVTDSTSANDALYSRVHLTEQAVAGHEAFLKIL